MMYETQLSGRMFYQSDASHPPVPPHPRTPTHPHTRTPPHTQTHIHPQTHTHTPTHTNTHIHNLSDSNAHTPTHTDAHSNTHTHHYSLTPKSSHSNARHAPQDSFYMSRTPPFDNSMDVSPQRQYMPSAEHQLSMQQRYGSNHMEMHGSGLSASVEDIPIEIAGSGADYKSVSDNADKETKIRVLREFYVGMLGIQTVFMFVNFAFANISGALLTMLGLFSGGYAHLDRRVSTYSLNAILQFVITLVVAISVGTTVPGFDLYKQDSTLQAISIAHVPLSFAFAVLSSYFARLEYLNAYKHKLANEGTEMPKVMVSENATHPMTTKDNELTDPDGHNMTHTDIYANVSNV